MLCADIKTNIGMTASQEIKGGQWVYREPSAKDLSDMRDRRERMGMPALPDDRLRELFQSQGKEFRDGEGGITPAEAAEVIVGGARRLLTEGDREGQWRILVGADAHRLDQAVRAEPERAYEFPGFSQTLQRLREEAEATAEAPARL